MSKHNVPLVVMMIIAIILLFAAMVLSSMASAESRKHCPNDDKSREFSMYSAVVCGIAVFLIAIALLIYIFRKPTVENLSKITGSAAQVLQQHADSLQRHADSFYSSAGQPYVQQ